MRAIIFTNGQLDPESARGQLRPGDLIVAADGGARHALALGVVPDLVIGDLDSLSPEEQARAEAAGAQVIRFSSRKDETDLELALLHAARAGAEEIVVLGALGGRLDQTLANVLLLALPALRGANVRIVEGVQEAFVIRDEALIHGSPGDTLSLIPLGGDALGVTADGVEWPLRDETLRFGLTRGISNVLVGERARVGVRKGILLCVVKRKDRETRRNGDTETRRRGDTETRRLKEVVEMKRIIVVVSMGLLVLAGCKAALPTPTVQPTPAGPRTLRVMTHDSFDIGEETIAAFEARYNAIVEILESGDTGVMLNQAILSKDNPLADVLYGVDNTFLGRALNAGIFEPYASPLLAEIPDDLELDSQHRALPVDYGDVCLNYDRNWFAERGLTPPANLEDLIKPEYRGLTVVENPATSSPGLAFMLATVGHFGETGDYTWLDYWANLRANDVLVVEGWEDAYWGQFTYGSKGEGQYPIVVSYASSPPVEVLFAEQPFEEAPTAAVVGDGACFRQIEFVGILKNGQNRDLAQAWVDYMLDKTFQEDIPLHMFMFPANQNAALPDVFVRFAVIPERPAKVDYAAIEANREAWVEAWTEVVLR